jgi:hypothetical protein
LAWPIYCQPICNEPVSGRATQHLATRSSGQPSRSAAHSATFRAAWPSRLIVSSTRPAPSSGLESTATLGQLLEVERLRRASKLDGALQQASVHVMADQSRTKGLVVLGPKCHSIECPSWTGDRAHSDLAHLVHWHHAEA